MTIIGQPESYSDMLKRIFASTLTVGILSTLGVAVVSPSLRSFLDSWDSEVKVSFLPALRALYVLVPLLVAILTRVFLLHDRISDLLGLRRRFDTEYILKPLAEGVGFKAEGDDWKKIESQRELAMTRTFYPYAGFRDPRIDVQLVRTAADRWGWFWCAIEATVVVLITGAICALIHAWLALWIALAATGVLILIAWLFWPQLGKGAKRQVEEIVANQSWNQDIRSQFDEISGA